MTRDQHLEILEFIDRTMGGAQPPIDVEADAIIRALFKRNPDLAYRMTMLAMSLSPPAEVRPGGQGEAVDSPRRGWLAALFDKRESATTRREPVLS
jgi:hypothetical protein